MPLRLLSISIALALALGACSSTEPGPPPDTPAASLPLLTPGLTVGTTLYGSANVDDASLPVQALLDSAVARGLGGFTYYVDWADLEPEPGRYTLDTFEATLAGLQELGVVPFVNITVGDIEAYNLPDGLSDGAGGLAAGVSLDDEAVVSRFGGVLSRVAPIVAAKGGFFLGVGNEVDARLDGDFTSERAAYVRFVQAARERVHAVEPSLAVGVTVTNHAVRAQSETFRSLRTVSDAVAFNYSPIQPDFFVLDTADVARDFREVVTAFGEGPILIQELTCPSPESMGASEAWQRACFERLFAEIKATPQVRFASVFTLQDFDTPTCTIVQDVMLGGELDGLPEDVAQRLAEYICFLGVVREDGSPKPAWHAILNATDAEG